MLKFENISQGNSFFQFINKYWYGNYESNDRPLHRLCSLLRKMGVQSAIIEKLNAEDYILIKEEKLALERYFDHTIDVEIFRLSFCNKKISSEEELKLIDSTNSFLANAIIFNFKIKDKWDSFIFNMHSKNEAQNDRLRKRSYLGSPSKSLHI